MATGFKHKMTQKPKLLSTFQEHLRRAARLRPVHEHCGWGLHWASQGFFCKLKNLKFSKIKYRVASPKPLAWSWFVATALLSWSPWNEWDNAAVMQGDWRRGRSRDANAKLWFMQKQILSCTMDIFNFLSLFRIHFYHLFVSCLTNKNHPLTFELVKNLRFNQINL